MCHSPLTLVYTLNRSFFYIFVHMYIAFFCYLMGMGDVVSEETVMFYLNLSLF